MNSVEIISGPEMNTSVADTKEDAADTIPINTDALKSIIQPSKGQVMPRPCHPAGVHHPSTTSLDSHR